MCVLQPPTPTLVAAKGFLMLMILPMPTRGLDLTVKFNYISIYLSPFIALVGFAIAFFTVNFTIEVVAVNLMCCFSCLFQRSQTI